MFIKKYIFAFLIGSFLMLGYIVPKQTFDFFAKKYDEMQSPYPLREEYAFFWMSGLFAGDSWYNTPFNYLKRKAYESAIKQLPDNEPERFFWEKGVTNLFDNYKPEGLYEAFIGLNSNKSKNRKFNEYYRFVLSQNFLFRINQLNVKELNKRKIENNFLLQKSISNLKSIEFDNFIKSEEKSIKYAPFDYLFSTQYFISKLEDICSHKEDISYLVSASQVLFEDYKNVLEIGILSNSNTHISKSLKNKLNQCNQSGEADDQ